MIRWALDSDLTDSQRAAIRRQARHDLEREQERMGSWRRRPLTPEENALLDALLDSTK